MNSKIIELGLMPGDRIVVPKSGFRIVQHHAIYVGQDKLGQHLIVENKIGFGVRVVTSDLFFSDVLEITRIEKFKGSPYDRRMAVQKALQKVGKPYLLIDYNCQHFANEVQHNSIQSEQVQSFFEGLKFVGTACLLFAIAGLFKNE